MAPGLGAQYRQNGLARGFFAAFPAVNMALRIAKTFRSIGHRPPRLGQKPVKFGLHRGFHLWEFF